MTYTFTTTDDQDAAMALHARTLGLADAAATFAWAAENILCSIVATHKQQLSAQLEALPLATLQTLVADNTTN